MLVDFRITNLFCYISERQFCRSAQLYSELYSIAIAVMSVHQFDNQLYHELNQSRSGQVVYSNLLRPGESNNNKVTETTAEGYYDFSRPIVAENFEQIQPENEQHQPQANEGSSQKQAVPPYTSLEKKLQLVIIIVIFLTVVLLMIMFLLVILIVVMFIKEAPASIDNGHLENITESVMSLHHLVNQQLVYSKNNTNYTMKLIEQSTENTVNLIQQSSKNSTQQLINIVSTLNNLKGTSTSTAGVVDDILLVVEKSSEIQNASVFLNFIHQPVSCKDIKTLLPNGPTGYYLVNSQNIYCNMEELCGTGGGWTRLAYLDMSDSTVNCPTGLTLRSGGFRACGRKYTNYGSCSSVQYPSNGTSYSQICGRVVGYQYGSTESIHINHNINTYYVDGVSITHGSPRQHVWTLMAGLKDSFYDVNNCPCNTTLNGTVSFIGSNYFCESGNPTNSRTRTLYTEDPLWDGQGCGTNETACCSAPGLPWFHRDYGNVTTTDYIELRVCADQGTSNEDVRVSFYEIYVK